MVNKKLDKLYEKKRLTIEKIKKEEAREKAHARKKEAREKNQARKKDTRRKILVGAIVLKQMEHDTRLKAEIYQLLNTHLDKPANFELFDLPSRVEITASSTPVLPDETVETA